MQQYAVFMQFILHKVFCLASCVGSEAELYFSAYFVLYSALVQLSKLSKTLLFYYYYLILDFFTFFI
jgi:hypothetical protein